MEQIKNTGTRKVISNKAKVEYSGVVQDGKFLGILEENETGETLYYFEPDENQPRVTDELLEIALKAMIRTNATGFDIMTVCFYGLERAEEYRNIAIKVFKDYWNELYNMGIADDVFGRESSLSTVNETYDFFKDE